MILLRKDVTIKANSTKTKEEAVQSVILWLEEMQLEPEYEDDLYYAEVFDSRDNSIYRIFSSLARQEYNITKIVFDIVTPDMLNFKGYVNNKVENLISNTQLNLILNDHIANIANNKQDIDSIIQTLTGFISNNQLMGILNDYVTEEELLLKLNNLVTIDDFNHKINNVLTKIVNVENILKELDTPVDITINEIIETQSFNNAMNDTISNYLNYYITENSLLTHLNDYVSKSELNDIVSTLPTTLDISNLSTRINNISYVNDDVIYQLNSLTSLYNMITSDMLNVQNDIINNNMLDSNVCDIKQKIIELEKNYDSFLIVSNKLDNVQDRNIELINNTNIRIDNFVSDISNTKASIVETNLLLDDIRSNISSNMLNINNIFDLISSNTEIDFQNIENFILQYFEDNPIVINNYTTINNDIDNIKNEITLIKDDIQVNNSTTTTIIIDDSIIWKSLEDGYNSYSNCN